MANTNETVGRLIEDANLTATKALPAAGASAQTDAFDLGAEAFRSECFDLQVSLPATPALAASETVTFTILNDTAATPTTAYSPATTYVVTGTAGTGAAAKSFRMRIKPDTSRYLAVRAAVSANGGNNVAVSFTAKLLF